MEAVRMRGGALLRANVVATIVLTVVAGLSAGLALGAWAAARRGAGAYDRLLDHLQPAEFSFGICGFPADAACTKEALDAVRTLPEVATAVRVAAVPMRFDLPNGAEIIGGVEILLDEGMAMPDGEPIVIDGKLLDVDAADEALVPENVAQGLPVGTVVRATPIDITSATPLPNEGLRHDLRIAGIVRTPSTLIASTGAINRDPASPVLGPGWWARYGEQVTPWGIALQVRGRPGQDPAALRAAVVDALGARVTEQDELSQQSDLTVPDAIRFETWAMALFAAVSGLAALVFVGQALARQARLEAADQPALVALGASRAQLGASAAVRALPMAVGAALLAGTLAWAGSAVTPVGLAGRAEPLQGFQFDPVVSVIGGVLTAMLVLACSTWPALRLARRASGARDHRLLGPAASRLRLPTTAVAGATVVLPGGRGVGVAVRAASAGLATVVVVAVGAAGLSASLRHLQSHPSGYGVTWDSEVDGILQAEQGAAALGVVEASDVVAGVAERLRSDAEVAGRPAPVVAFDHRKGNALVPWVEVMAGREPQRPGEAAIGPVLARRLGATVGDTVRFGLDLGPAMVEESVVVVGVAVAYSGLDGDPGSAVVVVPEWLQERRVGWSEPVVRLVPGADRSGLDAELAGMGLSLRRPVPPAGVRNLARVAWLPWLLVGVVAALAVAALFHALVLTVRRQRGQLAVLHAIGCTPAQAGGSVVWAAMLLCGAALVVGLPLGVIVGRWGWRWLADMIGVAGQAAVPLAGVAVVAILTVLAGALVSLWPAWKVARLRLAHALRAA